MIAGNSDPSLPYDANAALRLASNIPSVRDRIVTGILGLFSAGGELSALFDIAGYRSDPPRTRTLAHRAVGLAKQAAMPRLELVCREIDTALERGEFATAEELGRNLPATIEEIRAAVAAASSAHRER